MICEKYDKLTVVERVILIGQLCHSMQSDNEFFDAAKTIISNAKIKGLFDNVIILPNSIENY